MRKVLVIFLTIVAVLATGAFLVWHWANKKGGLRSAVVQTVVEQIISNPQESSIVPKVLGFEKPQTYLVLFLNNTEIRPGGGFIGAYAVMRFDKGTPEILKVEGTEILDNYANQSVLPTPPKALEEYLGIKKWAFRDSNWSPDFALSSIQSLDLFKKENGIRAVPFFNLSPLVFLEHGLPHPHSNAPHNTGESRGVKYVLSRRK